jgi:trans-aconitate 2-methyltransferase
VSWSAAQYLAFEDERTRPVRDLLGALPPGPDRTAIDIGCGPGNSTERLVERLPGAEISGLDSSEDMIAAARKRLPQLRFELARIDEWVHAGSLGALYDVILANAVLQWLPDHARLLPALVRRLSAGGTLAVQMPDNLEEPTHRLMRNVAAEARWAEKLAPALATRTSMANADWYYALLRAHCSHVNIWRTTYYHPLAGGASAVVEWFKGSGLRPFLDRLDASEISAYLQSYETQIANAYPSLADGTILLPFPRLFIIAVR